MPTELEALFGGLSRWCDCDHGSSAADSLYGPACPLLGVVEVVTLGSISVDLTHSEVLARKANTIAEVISRSQRPAAEDIEEATVGEEVLQLMSNSVEPQVEDLQTWKRAYQEDPRLKRVLYKLRQGQPCGGQYLTLAGLLAVK